MDIYIGQILSTLLEGMGVILMGGAAWLLRTVIARAHISLTAEQKAEWEDVARKSVTWAISQAQVLIRAKGWDHVDVHNQIVKLAAAYAVEKFPDAMSRNSVEDERDTKVTGVMSRVIPSVMQEVAYSPSTPPAPHFLPVATNGVLTT
jgi:hypothetical protein